MTVKTITLDLEAYELLRRHKRGKQSFSQVVKEHFAAVPTMSGFRDALARMEPSDEFLNAVEEQIERRRENPARVIDL